MLSLKPALLSQNEKFLMRNAFLKSFQNFSQTSKLCTDVKFEVKPQGVVYLFSPLLLSWLWCFSYLEQDNVADKNDTKKSEFLM